MTPDATLSDVELALDALGEVTGRVVKDDVTNRIFERFCVGNKFSERPDAQRASGLSYGGCSPRRTRGLI